MAQRFSPEIPWVLIAAGRTHGGEIYCEVCGERAWVGDRQSVDAFVYSHREHTAGDGYIGAGDAFAAIAKPIANAFGAAPCTPCEARRRALNQFRFPRPW